METMSARELTREQIEHMRPQDYEDDHFWNSISVGTLRKLCDMALASLEPVAMPEPIAWWSTKNGSVIPQDYFLGLPQNLRDEWLTHAKPLYAAARGELSDAKRIYLDCDGVLADFDAAFEKAFGHPARSYEEANGSKVFWENLKTLQPPFYRNLPVMPGAIELYDRLKHLRPIILTGCPMGGWAEHQKMQWGAEHFPGVPMITCMARDKAIYCKPGDILIDDRTQYRSKWEAVGGVFIHYTGDVDEAIRQALGESKP